MRIILDFGSGNTCQNNIGIVERMLNELHEVDTGKQEVIIKWQLFQKADNNIPLKQSVFDYAYKYAKSLGYNTTASVFDKDYLEFLLGYDIPFVKISCGTNLWNFINKIPTNILIYKSIHKGDCRIENNVVYLSCIPKYPADYMDYRNLLGRKILDREYYISDHSIGWDVYTYYQPMIYECHYKLPDSKGLDSGLFARTPNNLVGIL